MSDEITPEQDKALDKVVDLVVKQLQLSEELAKELDKSKIPAPSPVIGIQIIAKKLLAREDLPEMMRMPLPLLQEYLHKMLHLSMDKDEEVEKLK